MSKRDVVSELAGRSRADWGAYAERRGLKAVAVHDEKLEKLRQRIVTLGGDARSFDVLVGVMITLEELPPAFGRAHKYVGSAFRMMLGLVAELVETGDDERVAREVFALLEEGATPPSD